MSVLGTVGQFIYAPGRRTGDTTTVRSINAAVAGADELVLLRPPLHRASQARADRREHTWCSARACTPDDVHGFLRDDLLPTIRAQDREQLGCRGERIPEILQC